MAFSGVLTSFLRQTAKAKLHFAAKEARFVRLVPGASKRARKKGSGAFLTFSSCRGPHFRTVLLVGGPRKPRGELALRAYAFGSCHGSRRSRSSHLLSPSSPTKRQPFGSQRRRRRFQ